MMESHAPVPRLSFSGGVARESQRSLPAEVAVALSYNGSTHAVMMATPADLPDFARGFTRAEGIAAPEEIERIDVVETPLGIDLQIWLEAGAAARQAQRRRSMAGPVGCGLCGLESLEEAVRAAPKVQGALRMTPAQVMAAVADLPKHQPLHDMTRAAHCAALWTSNGIALSREDVGRHNAVDKLVGAMAQTADSAALILTSRVSIDLVQKACAAGFSVLIAVSAPTAAAVQMAHVAGLTLIANARPDGFDCYTHPHRLTDPKEVAHVA
ncbi:MAG: formate dehydrogenase accessory sulfurtransferase FdhD [Pseudotabrizicola sp.]|uniref:formate dehydrogenase accessory sulfurtransferase FdhD n=1 Tax=Pseudotabrizicola sp. TaxID=2939647 RepID=UPI00272F2C6E|nr:formate dehydrogenase accessory sulfurtransferase FdhD [Pseudotabrizicola sp.]MDP2079909.1 formate dehydrogenase accessory sulfurtransferase FdhD [Pseudotabrizicola sp.]MDZ7575648.1 formate dehydrogenase accessory sulfurtransferase FdhD [Pseudotabrizicola sp.]